MDFRRCPMRVIIEEVSPGAEGVWTANVDPQRLIRLAKPIRQGGSLNVVLVARPSCDTGTHSLQFDLDSAILLNLGNTFETVLIDSREREVIKPAPGSLPHTQKQPSGDRRFLEELSRLPDSLRKVGDELLAEVRKEYPGELVFHQKSGKFVESPDNFWVVRIQPRAKSLRIIVYGTPKEHGPQNLIALKDDMASYSNFVIDSQHQILEAVGVIGEAKRLKDRR
jgi:hypothetical protein